MKKARWAHRTPDDTNVVVVNWRDIRSEPAWETDSDADVRPCRNLYTTGWLLHDGPDPEEPGSEIVVIAGTYDREDKTWAEFTVFPKAVIKGVH